MKKQLILVALLITAAMVLSAERKPTVIVTDVGETISNWYVEALVYNEDYHRMTLYLTGNENQEISYTKNTQIFPGYALELQGLWVDPQTEHSFVTITVQPE